MNPEPMTTMSEVMNNLKKKGITAEIALNETNEIVNMETEKTVQSKDIVIIKTYRFEGFSDPGDNAALYLTKDKNGNYAYIIENYSAASANLVFDSFLKEIKVDESKYDI